MNADSGTVALTGQRDDPFHVEGVELLVPLRSKARSGERTLAHASVEARGRSVGRPATHANPD
jgi:hypothetical protein